MSIETLNTFCDEWLKAWTGNNPEGLLQFYSEDAFYSDPGVQQGLTGAEQIFPYYKKLLAHNPHWVWTREELIPTEKGFTLKWKASIPVGEQTITAYGLDIVEVVNNKITRNEVYFDRSELLQALHAVMKK